MLFNKIVLVVLLRSARNILQENGPGLEAKLKLGGITLDRQLAKQGNKD